jgi:hypothetical protein
MDTAESGHGKLSIMPSLAPLRAMARPTRAINMVAEACLVTY